MCSSPLSLVVNVSYTLYYTKMAKKLFCWAEKKMMAANLQNCCGLRKWPTIQFSAKKFHSIYNLCLIYFNPRKLYCEHIILQRHCVIFKFSGKKFPDFRGQIIYQVIMVLLHLGSGSNLIGKWLFPRGDFQAKALCPPQLWRDFNESCFKVA